MNEQRDLQGLTALVTGATSGIGKAAAEELARHGAEVVAHGRDAARGEAVTGAITAEGGKTRFVAADLSDRAGPGQLAEQAGRVDILVNNAGFSWFGPTADLDVATLFIDGLGLATVDILGHSMGGEIAQQIALDRPDLVRRLVLVGTGPRGGVPQDPGVAPLFTKRDELGADMWLPIMFSPSKESQAAGRAFISRITARTQDRDVPVSDETITAYRAAAREWGTPAESSFDYLSRIAQPALVVNGNNDIVIPTINSYHLYQHLPNAELMLFPDSNHGAHFQYPARFARRVIDFLDIAPHEGAA